MAASETLTFDDVTNGIRRPSDEDLGDFGLLDDETFGPINRDGSEPYSAMFNQRARQIRAASKMFPLARVTFSTVGTPAAVKLQQPGSLLALADFVVTDNGVGDVTVTILKTKLPALGCDPDFTQGFGVRTFAVSDVSTTTHWAWRVTLFNAGGAAVDARFNIAIN